MDERRDTLTMTSSPISQVVQQLQSAALRHAGAAVTDGDLLERFVSGRDPAALDALVRRHARMVWGTCRRILRDHHAAEDAFQATFLVLVRKAAAVAPREMVGNWLYGVARQTALKARATAARRRTREKQVADVPEPEAAGRDDSCDLLPLLDHELARLPDKYRVAVVLCDLEGKTRTEAARELGWPEGTVGGRLARARALLARRMARHGLAPAAGPVAAVLSRNAASACVPPPVLSATLAAARRLLLTGTATKTGGVAALTEGVLKTMLLNKLRAVTAALLAAAAVGAGISGLALRTQAGGPVARQKEEPKAPPAAAPAKKDATDKGLKLTLSADKTETTMQADGKNAVPVKLKLTVTNNTDKPVELDAYLLKWRMRVRCVGPTPDSVEESFSIANLPADFRPPPRTPEDSPVLQPGKSWSPTWTREFPGSVPDGFSKSNYFTLRKTGAYKLRVTLSQSVPTNNEGEVRTTWLESNELELKVREPEAVKSQPEGNPVKGLKLTLSADKTETRLGPDGGAVPVKWKLTITNTGDKAVKLNAYLLAFRMKFHCTGPDPDGVRGEMEYVHRPQPAPPAEEDAPVLQPGKSWSPGWTRQFPGDVEEGAGKAWGYAVRKAGTYKLRVTLYENLLQGDEKEAERTRWLESNELELTVRDRE